jgi:hypothetical protein
MVGRLTVVDLGADHVLFEAILIATDDMLNDEAQKPTEPFGTNKYRASEYPSELFSNGGLRSHNVIFLLQG